MIGRKKAILLLLLLGGMTILFLLGKREISSAPLSAAITTEWLMQHYFLLDNVLIHDNYTVPPQYDTMYTLPRNDRSGAIIQDMLMAHAWLFAQGKKYGGACSGGRVRAATKELLEQLGLISILPYVVRCNNSEQVIRDKGKYQYRKYDSELMTASWRSHVLREWDEANLRKHHNSSNHHPRSNFKIVVHIRRGDVSPCRHADRYLTNDYYQKLIDQYTPEQSTGTTTTAPDLRNITVTIYSEARSHENFTQFLRRGYNVVLDSPSLGQVWHDIINADVAILSRSGFSFAPAILNRRGTVVYTPFWHRPNPEWTKASSTESPSWEIVDTATLARNQLQVQHLGRTECCGKDKCTADQILTRINNSSRSVVERPTIATAGATRRQD